MEGLFSKLTKLILKMFGKEKQSQNEIAISINIFFINKD